MQPNNAILQDPYPVPCVSTFSVERNYGQKLGITVKVDFETRVVVSAIRPDSILHEYPIQINDEILAINGIAVHKAKQAGDIMKAFTKLEFTVLTSSTRDSMTSCCYVEVAPISRINPGISFDSCCHRSLVMISDIFIPESTTNLNRGDIVLAINGVPVWKPEAADNLQLLAARDCTALVLYCVNMDILRILLAKNAKMTHNYGADVRRATIARLSKTRLEIRERGCQLSAQVDMDTQLLKNITDMDNLYKFRNDHVSKKVSYEHVCLPTFKSLNSLLTKQLIVLKDAVVKQAWKYSIQKSEDSIPTFTVPSAPSIAMAVDSNDPDSPYADIPVANAVAVAEANVGGGSYEL